MRLLVACSDCKKQYDASSLSAGSRFRCLCGAVLEVHQPEPHDAAVVRCSSCGAPRQGESVSCHFCSADFTLHERDLHTICPECMARVSDQARFCHHCASPLIPSGIAGEPAAQACPVCQSDRMLTSRQLGDPAIGILECPTCAGLWLAADQFKILLQRVRAVSAVAETAINVDPQGYQARNRVSQEGPLYRACPECGNLMHRRNFGRKSGIIVDHCGEHGYWFDAEELDGVLRWVRQGGEQKLAQLADQERRESLRQEKLSRQLDTVDSDWLSSHSQPRSLVDVLGWLVSRVLIR
jgi:Zn-finger nucleic acid-binding protein